MRGVPTEDDPLSLAEILEEEAMLLDGRLSKDDPISPRRRAGLCLSGGGIRSATFGLGVLQSLARLGLLDKFDYLSTVSGGGYIGSWFTAWIHRHPRGLTGVIEDLQVVTPKAEVSDRPHPVQWLRSYSNYLSPHLGFFSADSWTLLGIYLRNLHLNWLVLLPLLMLPLLVPRGIIAVAQLNVCDIQSPPCASRSIYPLLLIGFGLAVMALIYLHLCRPTLREYRRHTRWRCLETQGWFLTACLLPLVGATVALTTAWAWFRNAGGTMSQLTLYQSVLGGAVIHTGSWLFATVALKRFKAPTWWLVGEAVAVMATGALGGGFLWSVLEKTPDHMAVAQYAEWFACFAVPGVLAMFLLTATMFIGLASHVTEEQDREWWGRTGSWVLIVMVTWTILCAVVIFGPGLIHWMTPAIATSVGGLSGLMTLILGFGSRTTAQQQEERSHLTILTDAAVKAAAPVFMLCVLIALALVSSWQLDVFAQRFGNPLSDLLTPLPIGEQMLPDPWGHNQVLHHASLKILLLFASVLALLLCATAACININRFSLHAMYRNRLIRAYLGASRGQREREKSFNPLTGFDNLDNPAMNDLRFDDVRLARWLYAQGLSPEARVLIDSLHVTPDPSPAQRQAVIDHLHREVSVLLRSGALLQATDRLRLGSTCAAKVTALQQQADGTGAMQDAMSWLINLLMIRLHERRPGPLHLINIALNLVKGDNLAWQQRKAQSFTISSLHSGSWNLGYRRTETYAANQYLDQPLSLGTALAISGAAASPNMGYHSSSAVTFLLALFNIRLGWWLGNPGKAGARTYRQASPTVSVGPLISEAFGLTDADHPYVYLSDGGHFENLGLYEMVLRRCHSILVVDAGCDPHATFEDLGNAIRKIRIDLGIDIEIDLDALRRRSGALTCNRHHAIGSIRYDNVHRNAAPGTLLYLKASLTGDEPSDIQDYAARHPAFPHEPTSDQFFDEAQFESYRRLGEHVAQQVLSPAIERREQDFSDLCHVLRTHWVTTPPGMRESFLGETNDLKDLERLLRDDPELLRYDLEIYPELHSVFGIDPSGTALNPRTALHTCNLQIQLMEQVYLAVNLDEFHRHTLNRGWMNLFRRWTSSATFRLCWPTLCGMYSQQFVRFADQHLSLGLDHVLMLEPMGTARDLTSLFRDLSIEWAAVPGYAEAFMRALERPLPLEEPSGDVTRLAAWQMRLPAVDSQAGAGGAGEILAVVTATRLSVAGHQLAIHGWVRPAYRGLKIGHRLFDTAITALMEAYHGHTLIVDLGPDNPTWAGTSIRNVGWLRFYEQLGFTRDRSDPARFRMSRLLR